MKQLLQPGRYQTALNASLFLVLLISCGVLVGWETNIHFLKRGLEGSVAVNPITALSFITAVICLYKLNKTSGEVHWWPRIVGGMVGVIGIWRILELSAGMPTNSSEWLFADKLVKERIPNTMAPNTAFCFFLAGSSLLLYNLRRWWLPLGLSMVVLLIAIFSIIGYLYNAPEFYNIATYIPMALPTAFCFFVFSAAFIMQRMQEPILNFLQSPLQGNRMARFLVPFAIAIPLLIGKLRMEGEQQNLYSSEFGSTAFAVASIALFMVLIWRSAVILNRANVQLNEQIKATFEMSEELRIEQNKEFERQKMRDNLSRQKQLIAATIHGQEKEKKQLGMELHDHINQILASTKMYVEMAKNNGGCRDELLDKAGGQLTYAINEIRNLSKSMVLHGAEEGGIYCQISEMIQNISYAGCIRIHSNIPEQIFNKLQVQEQVALYRIIEEQLSNIVKHASCSNVYILLAQNEEELCFTIRDDGKGFDVKAKRRGIGLSNIASRAELLNGQVRIDSQPGQGCTIEVTFSTEV